MRRWLLWGLGGCAAVTACGADGGVADLALPPADVPWLALEYEVRVEVLGGDCAPGGLAAQGGQAVATVTQDGRRVGWVQKPAGGDAAQWALSGQMCADDAAPTGWRLHLAGGRVLRVVDGDDSCRVDTVLPVDGALGSTPTCTDPGIDLIPDECGRLTGEAVSVLFDFGAGCARAAPCELMLRVEATPRRADPRDPAPALGCDG